MSPKTTRRSSRHILAKTQGGPLHPHFTCQNDLAHSVIGKVQRKKPKPIPYRKCFREAKFVTEIGHKTSIIAAVFSARKSEHLEFLEFGYEESTPDISHLDVAAIRNWLLLYNEHHNHVQLDEDKFLVYLNKARLQNEEPAWGQSMRDYYKTKRPDEMLPAKEDGTKDLNVIHLIKGILNKYGGSMETMLHLTLKANPKMTPHVYNRNGRYGVSAVEYTKPLALYRCAYCSVVNIVWLEDIETGIHGQHCGLCYGELDNEVLSPSLTKLLISFPNLILQLRVGAQQLSMASKTNMLDGMPDLPPSTLHQLADQDLRNIRAIMSRRTVTTVKVDNGMSNYQLQHLRKKFLSYNLVTGRTTPNPHAMLASERKLIWRLFSEKLSPSQHMIEIGSRRPRDKAIADIWHGIGPILDWRDVERYPPRKEPFNTCNHTLDKCNCTVYEGSLLVAIDSLYDVDSMDVINYMVKHKIEHILYCLSTVNVNFDKIQGELLYNQGTWCRDNNRLVTCLVGDDRPYNNNWYITKMWSTADLIRSNNRYLHIKTIMKLGNHLVRIGTLSDFISYDLVHKTPSVDHSTRIQLEVPLISSDTWLGFLNMPVIIRELRYIDLNLYRALYSRNMTGGISFEKMIEFGLAYAHSKYKMGSTMVHHRHISANDVRLHALLATIATRRKVGWVKDTILLSDPNTRMGLNPLVGTMTGIFEYVISILKKYMGTITDNSNVASLIKPMWEKVKSWLEEPIWDVLDELVDVQPETGLIEYVMPLKLEYSTTHTNTMCHHHLNTCNHRIGEGQKCACCKSVDVVESMELCICCQPKDCEHKCAHGCIGPKEHIGNLTQKICDCCGVKYTTQLCIPCNRRLFKDDTSREPVFEKPSNNVPRQKVYTSKVTYPAGVPTLDEGLSEPPIKLVDRDRPTQKDKAKESSILENYKRMMGENASTQQGKEVDIPPPTLPTAGIPTADDLLFTKLVDLTNLEYALIVRFGWENVSKNGNLVYPDSNPIGKPGISELKYTMAGSSVMYKEDIFIENTTPVKGDGLCGFYAIQKAIGNECRLVDLQTHSNKQSWFDNEDIMTYLATLGYNSVILQNHRSMINTIDVSTRNYVVIGHSEMEYPGTLHWEPRNILQLNTLGAFPCYNGAFTNTQFERLRSQMNLPFDKDNMTETERLTLGIKLMEKYSASVMTSKAIFTRFTIFESKSNWFLTNNSRRSHSPNDGLFCIRLSPYYKNVIQLVTQDTTLMSYDQLVTSLHDIPDMDNAKIDEVVLGLVKEICSELYTVTLQSSGSHTFDDNLWKLYNVKATTRKDGVIITKNPDQKLKTGDIICVEHQGRKFTGYVSLTDETLFVQSDVRLPRGNFYLKLYVPKISAKSKLIQLNNINQELCNFDNFKKLIKNSTVVLGPAGSGKTTKLISKLGAGDVVITRTRVAAQNIRDKTKQLGCRVMTYEKFSTLKLNIPVLYIDECTMFGWLDLFVGMRSLPTHIEAYGDEHQIGVIDTNILSGTREVKPFHKYVEKITTLDTTYRYGKSMADMLTSSGIKVTSLAQHDTSIRTLHLDTFDEPTIRDIILETHPDVILTIYQQAKTALQKITKIPVETVHSYQSKEADKVLVIQYNTQGSGSSLWLDSKYCISAATRAKYELTWVCIGLSARSDLVTILRGNSTTLLTGGAVGNRDEDEIITGLLLDHANFRAIPENNPRVPMNNLTAIILAPQVIRGINDALDITGDMIEDLAKYNDGNTYMMWLPITIDKLEDDIRSDADTSISINKIGLNSLKVGTLGISVTFDLNDKIGVINTKYSWGSERILKSKIQNLYEIRARRDLIDYFTTHTIKEWKRIITPNVYRCALKIWTDNNRLMLPTNIDEFSINSTIQQDIEEEKIIQKSPKRQSREAEASRPRPEPSGFILRSPRDTIAAGPSHELRPLRRFRRLPRMQRPGNIGPELDTSTTTAQGEGEQVSSDKLDASNIAESSRSAELRKQPADEESLVTEHDQHDAQTFIESSAEEYEECVGDDITDSDGDDTFYDTIQYDDEVCITANISDKRLLDLMIKLYNDDTINCKWYTNNGRSVYTYSNINEELMTVSMDSSRTRLRLLNDNGPPFHWPQLCIAIEKWNNEVHQLYDEYRGLCDVPEEIIESMEKYIGPNGTYDEMSGTRVIDRLIDRISNMSDADRLTDGIHVTPANVEESEIPDEWTAIENSFHNSIDNRHYCNEASAYWKQRDLVIDNQELFKCTMSNNNNTLLRKICESIQCQEYSGCPVIIPIVGEDFRLSTIGGCSLCCGLTLTKNNSIILKLMPRKNIRNMRIINIPNSMYSSHACDLLSALGIQDYNISTRYGEVDSTIDTRQLIHPIVNQSHYELGMLFERISTIPSVLWELRKRPKGNRPMVLCNQYRAINEAYVEQLISKLNPGLDISPICHVPSYTSIEGCKMLIVGGDHLGFAQLIENTLYVTNANFANHTLHYTMTTTGHMDNMFYERKNQLWQWRLSRKLTFDVSNNQGIFGEDDTILSAGLNLPLTYHQSNKTPVYTYYQEKLSSEILANMIKTYNILFVHPNHIESYGELLKSELYNMPIEAQGINLMESGLDLLIEQVMFKYYYNGLAKGDSTLIMTQFPYLPMIISAWGACSIPVKESDVRYRQNLIDCPSILKKVLDSYEIKDKSVTTKRYEKADEILMACKHQIETKNGPWYISSGKSTATNTDHLLFGLSALQYSIRELIDIIHNSHSKYACMLVPAKITSTNKMFYIISEDDNNYRFAYDGSTHIYNMNKELVDTIHHGRCKVIGNKRFITHCTNIVMGHALVRITICDVSIPGPVYTRPMTTINSSNNIEFLIPKISDLRKFLSETTLLQKKKISIDSKLYRALSLRMLRPKTSLEDLLAYARTYSHTVAYTNTGYSSNTPSYINRLVEACVCVYYESCRLNIAIDDTVKLMSDSYVRLIDAEAFKNILKAVGLNVLGDVFSKLGAQVTTDEILTMLCKQFSTSKHTLINKLQSLTITKITKVVNEDAVILKYDDNVINQSVTNKAQQYVETLVSLSSIVKQGFNNWQYQLGNFQGKEPTSIDNIRESCISNMCRRLEDYVGQDLIASIIDILPDMISTYSMDELMKTAEKCLERISSPIQLRKIETNISILEDTSNLDIRGMLNEKGKLLVEVPITEYQFNRERDECLWMYDLISNDLKDKNLMMSSIGSRGDIEPLMAICKWLQLFGIKCTLAMPRDLLPLYSDSNISCIGLDSDSKELIKTCIEMEKYKHNIPLLMSKFKHLMKMTENLFNSDNSELIKAISETDLILETPFTHISSQIAQKYAKPMAFTAAYPWEYHRGITTRTDKLTLAECIAGACVCMPFPKSISDWRENVLHITNKRGLVLYTGGNPMVYLHSDILSTWSISQSSETIGYPIMMVEDQSIDISLLMKICTSPSVAICLGSMVGDDIDMLTTRILNTIPDEIKVAVIVGGTEYIHSSDLIREDLFITKLSNVPYHILFSLVDLVVTHGGSGTTHNAIRHGCPVIIHPFFGDQYAWLNSVEQLDIGTSLDKFEASLDRSNMYQTFKRNIIDVANHISKNDTHANLISNLENIYNAGKDHIIGIINEVTHPVKELMLYNNERVNRLDSSLGRWEDMCDVESSMLEINKCLKDLLKNYDTYSKTSVDNQSKEPLKYQPSTSRVEREFEDTSDMCTTINTGSKVPSRTFRAPQPSIRSKTRKFKWQHQAKLTSVNEVKRLEKKKKYIKVKEKASEVSKYLEGTSDDDVSKKSISKADHITVTQVSALSKMDRQKGISEDKPSSVYIESYPEPISPEPIPATTSPPVKQSVEISAHGDVEPFDPCGSIVDTERHIQHMWPTEFIISNITGGHIRSLYEVWPAKISVGGQLFNSSNYGQCVIDSLEFCMQKLEYKSVNVIQAMHLCISDRIPTLNEVRALVLISGLCLAIKTVSRTEIVGDGKTIPPLVLNISSRKGLAHCSVHSILESEYLPMESLSTLSISDRTRDSMNSNLAHVGLNLDTLRNNMFCSWVNHSNWILCGSGYSYEELRAKLTLSNIQYTTNRDKCPVLYCDWYADKEGYMSSVDKLTNLKHGYIVLCSTSAGFRPSIIYNLKEYTILIPCNWSPHEVRFNKLIIKTEIKLNLDLKKTVIPRANLIIEKDSTLTCLNITTVNAIRLDSRLASVNTICDANATDLLIYDFDNRQHHKYDLLDVVKKFSPSHVYGVGIDITGEMLEEMTKRNTGYRCNINKALYVATFECVDQARLNALETTIISSDLSFSKYNNELNIIQNTKFEQVKGRVKKMMIDIGADNGKITTDMTAGKYNQPIRLTTDILVDMGIDKQLLDDSLRDDCFNYYISLYPGVVQHRYHLNILMSCTLTMLTSSIMYVQKYYMPFKLTKIKIIGGNIEDRVSWKLPEEFKATKDSRWWEPIGPKPVCNFDEKLWVDKVNTQAVYHGIDSDEIRGPLNITMNKVTENNEWLIHNPITQWPAIEDCIMNVDEDMMYHHMAMWEDLDFSDWNDKYAPNNPTRLVSRLPATQYTSSKKSTLTEYPMYSRPVLHKAANQEFNAITGRIFNVQKYRKCNYDLQTELQLFVDTYFDPQKLDTLANYQINQLNFDENKIMNWLRDRPDSNKIVKELIEILETGLQVNPFNDVKVHIKLESLLKEEPASDLRQVKARTIMWQCKGYCSMFGHIFNEVKKRLKEMLKDKFVYADGLRADELSSRTRNVKMIRYILENDLSQQDRQTDHEIIKFEMELYKLLGVNPSVINLWQRCHNNWKIKASTVLGYSDAMRLSGQATTAIGNVITNLLVHRRLVSKIDNILELFMMLGDDGLMLLRDRVDVVKLNNELKTYHNMMCKPHLSSVSGTFCCMTVYINSDNTCGTGPDFIRLKRRFEVTNGVSDANDNNIIARCMSYCMMLGPLPEVNELIKREGWPVVPIAWYDYDDTINAICDKYECNYEIVRSHLHSLITMIKERDVYTREIIHLQEKI